MDRTRTSGELTYSARRDSFNWPVSCSNLTNTSTVTLIPDVALGEKKITTDFVVPNFKRRVAQGEVFFNNFTQTTFKNTHGGSAFVRHTNTSPSCTPPIYGFSEYTGAVFLNWIRGFEVPTANSSMPYSRIDSLVNESWTDCLANRQSGDANFFESLAEMDQAWRMVGSPLENIRSFNKNFARAKEAGRKLILKRIKRAYRIRNAARKAIVIAALTKALSDFLASEWLRYRYGIKPLISDVNAGFKTLSETYDREPRRYTARSNRYAVTTSSDTQNQSISIYTLVREVRSAHQVTVRAMFLDEYKAHPFQKLGFTYQNLLGLPWELTRLSFVADWGMNVGSLIYANIPRVDAYPRGGCITVKEHVTSYYYASSYSALPGMGVAVSGFPSDTLLCERIYKRRTPQSSKQPEFVIRDDFRLDNYTRAADAIAIIQRQFASLFGRSRIDLNRSEWL